MQIKYIGSLSSVFPQGCPELVRESWTEVPDKVGEQLIQNSPEEFQKKASKKSQGGD